jgi:uncharacterized membrane protein
LEKGLHPDDRLIQTILGLSKGSLPMDVSPSSAAVIERERRQLKRLQILIDVVYAVVIWRFFTLLPKPEEFTESLSTVGRFIANHADRFVIVLLGIVIVIVYWVQNNQLFGNLQRTDNKHTSLSILQLFFLLLFLYAIRIGLSFEGTAGAKLFESVAAALMGFTSVAAWAYATKDRRLLGKEMTNSEAAAFRSRIMTEPVTAVVTIPCAFIGPLVWELSWFVYPLVYGIFRKRGAKETR